MRYAPMNKEGLLVLGFIKNHGDAGYQSLVLADEEVTEKKFMALINDGWQHILDNRFESIDAAYEYLENDGIFLDDIDEPIFAYKDFCRMCEWFRPVEKHIGMYWKYVGDGRERKSLFNGRVCEQCLDGFESVKYKGRMMPPDHMHRMRANEFELKVKMQRARGVSEW